jgi:hypothetical protein
MVGFSAVFGMGWEGNIVPGCGSVPIRLRLGAYAGVNAGASKKYRQRVEKRAAVGRIVKQEKQELRNEAANR